MVEIRAVDVDTILRPTSIDLAPYVINPYQGCAMGCAFCYAQYSRTAQKQSAAWGSYVKVKRNAAAVLEREIAAIKPEKVLIGSTTECFQDVERHYHITESVLRVLEQAGIPYSIMSRSPRILSVLTLLRSALCRKVYFTVNAFPEALRTVCAEQAPAASEGIKVVHELHRNGVPVVAYVCPIMPFWNNWQEIMSGLSGAPAIECELMNFMMFRNDRLWERLHTGFPEIAQRYREFLSYHTEYDAVMADMERRIMTAAEQLRAKVIVHTHRFGEYFSNRYQS